MRIEGSLPNLKTKFLSKHGSADIKVTFEYGNGGLRPTRVHYEATAPNGQKINHLIITISKYTV